MDGARGGRSLRASAFVVCRGRMCGSSTAAKPCLHAPFLPPCGRFIGREAGLPVPASPPAGVNATSSPSEPSQCDQKAPAVLLPGLLRFQSPCECAGGAPGARQSGGFRTIGSANTTNRTSDPDIGSADPDGDGFTNEEEWRRHTDPEDKNSHPPYYTKLFFVQRILIQFRLRFMTTDGDPKKPAEMSFQINTLDLRQPSEFLKLGEIVPNTKLKLTKFEYKVVNDPATAEPKDASELTVTNIETGEATVLVKERVFDDMAEFSYEWHLPGQPELKPDHC